MSVVFQLKENTTKSIDLQHQLDKSKQQHQEVQALQQSTNGKLREAQVTGLLSELHKHYRCVKTEISEAGSM